MKKIRSLSFDTSFLLKDDPKVDKIIKELKRDRIHCFVTSTVISELEQLKIWGRISVHEYNKGISRWKRVNAKIIDFRNWFVSSELGKKCATSMEEHHGVKQEDIINDCNILVVGLKNEVDLFLSEDFHFTSKVTDEVLEDITHSACSQYKMMCGEEMYAVDSITFFKVYNNGYLDVETLKSLKINIKKPKKRLGKSMQNK